MSHIFHIAERADWDAARAAGGPYEISTRGRTLREEGFIHCSRDEAQAGEVLRAFYAGVGDLVLLEIDTARLDVPVRHEPADGDVFPHIYGPLPLDAVIQVRPLPANR
ncbi:DUF952 domain-containing protein [Actinomadura alba]|uniref:DUF952 domain-containing protein n=1 Tax=Actinomadura alba TaxID=406431 RepID=A0ABR7LNF6_9ACTN|nr:DUF952 domain-containing protein [Actinomadura alba]MBC6466094.1 DUF952 domain-containing protein [Actinomadura alba]